MLRRTILITILASLCTAWASDSTSDAASTAADTSIVIGEQSPAQKAPAAAATKETRPDLVASFAHSKRAAVIAGNTIFMSGALIQYALVLPKSLSLGPADLEDQLALLSPTILASGLRYAGPPMSCMRTSEAADAYEKHMGQEAPRNLAWTIYFTGWGLTVVSGFISAVPYALMAFTDTTKEYISEDLLVNSARGVSIAADVAWAAAGVYSFFYLMRLGETAETVETRRVTISPVAVNGGAGVSVNIRF